MTLTVPAPTATPPWPVGDSLEQAAAYVSAVRTAASPSARARATANKEGLTALRTMMRSLPKVVAEFSPEPPGEEMRAWFRPDRRIPFNRAPIALLDLPGSHAEYLRGRPRQALRTNLTRAAQVGIGCADVTSPDELRRVTEHLAQRRRQPPEDIVKAGCRPSADRLFAVAYDGDEPLGLAQALIDGPRAGLVCMVSATEHEHALLVRYALHSHLVERLIGRDVGRLVVGGSMLLTSPGTRYFQRRLGFGSVWLEPHATPRRLAA